MSYLYPIVSELTSSLNSGSYLDKTDYSIFYSSVESDFWFGISEFDFINFLVYDLDKNLKNAFILNKNDTFRKVFLTYYDEKNNSVPYEYKELLFELPLYKREAVLINPVSDAKKIELPDGEYIFNYQMTRKMSGKDPLIIKEISPSKTELKLIPEKNSIEYETLCFNEVQLKNVSPLYILYSKHCNYDKLYSETKDQYKEAVDLTKTIFFIGNDGAFVEFLQSIYEDKIKYVNYGTQTSEVVRTQGIKTYFQNFLTSESDNHYKFSEIKSKFESFVNKRLDILYQNFKSKSYESSRKYLFDIFVNYYFNQFHSIIENNYSDKYQSPLKNALVLNSERFIPILSTSYLDERSSDSDPLTLLVKLQYPVTDDISSKTYVSIINISNVPILFNTILKSTKSSKSIKISSPDFTVISDKVQSTNSNVQYTKTELDSETPNFHTNLSKTVDELNVDYTNFNNFVVFSSAELRHTIFKNKMITLAGISSSLSTLELSYSSSGYTYQYYTTEKETLETQKSDLIKTFDGFESYLYKTGHYEYFPTTKEFKSASFVSYMDSESARYDKFNQDSLINNTPEHIVTDSDNDDYLVFLSMVGHYFDNIYLYIKSLPLERISENENGLSKNTLQQIIQSFGWRLESSIDNFNLNEAFLDKSIGGSTTFSAEERTRQIWNRILNTLPLIYKTKGTEECIRFILSCYGIPSTALQVKEYGGFDYVDTDKTSYVLDEKIYMLNFKGTKDHICVPFDPTLKTIEFKVSLDKNRNYTNYEKIPLVSKYNQYTELDWTIGVYKEPKKYLGRAYFQLDFPTYKIGLIGDYGVVNSPTTQSIQVAASLTQYNPDIIITTGDNTYETNTNAYDNTVGKLYHQFISPYVGVSGSRAEINRFFPTIGDNDYISSAYTLYNAFFTYTPRFYTFKKGNVQFFILNSETEPSGSTVSSAQATWVKSQISSSLNDCEVLWRVAIFHRPWISSGNPANLASWMEWPWKAWGFDLIINGQYNFYERLEDNDIPIIIQGCGGSALDTFSNVVPESKFRWNNSHGYSVLTAKGNTLKVSVFDMYGNQIYDTGSVTLTSCSIDTGKFVIAKNNVPFSDKPFRQQDKFILSDPIPIFNGEIFNIMVRKNNPDPLFEYTPYSDLVPTKYDLWVQRKEDDRSIFNSYSHDILTKTYNNKFSNAGKLYFGNYENSGSFVGVLDKILIWSSPITDSNFQDHCNNINSYSFTGLTIPYETLYFRMNYDYPVDLSTSNPHSILNSNEYYSSSVSGSAYNFGMVYTSCSIDSCTSTSYSIFPYQFEEILYNQTFTATSYGPNRFKNQKIRKVNLELSSKLDNINRSTYSPNRFVSPDSILIGVTADPNDYKNKDIFRYLGGNGITKLVAAPDCMFDDKYYELKSIREEYNRSGNKKTLYNELFTLYKFYFDKAVFETIKQVIPARSYILTGISIEPTVLERPKYQYKKISSEECDVLFTSSVSPSPITSSLTVNPKTLSFSKPIYTGGTLGSDIIFANFSTTPEYEHIPFYLPNIQYSPTNYLYKEYLSLKNKLVYVSSGWIKKYPQQKELKNIEYHSDWPLPSDFLGFYYTGSGYYFLNNCYFYVEEKQKKQVDVDKNLMSVINLPSLGNPSFNNQSYFTFITDISNSEELGCQTNDIGKIMEAVFSGSSARYVFRKWNKERFLFIDGKYSKPQQMVSQSIFLYSTEIVNEKLFDLIAYTASFIKNISRANVISQQPNVLDYSPIRNITENGWYFTHDAGTFKNRPNTKTNNLFPNFYSDYPENAYVFVVDSENYFETTSGYSRNHLTHKNIIFSPFSYSTVKFSGKNTEFEKYIKSRQTINTTIDYEGLNDGSVPVQSINVSNVNITKIDNVLDK